MIPRTIPSSIQHNSGRYPNYDERQIFNVITICGSMRFASQMREHCIRLTMLGYVVLMPVEYEHLTPKQEKQVRKSHLEKIDLSDAIFVVNVDGYVGNDTAREIEYASKKGKKIFFINDEGEENEPE